MKLKLATLTMLALAGCATANKAHYFSSTCETQSIASPDGVCRAYYKQDWSSPSISTLLIVGCRDEGGRGLTGFSEQAQGGMVLRWLANDRLEIALPPGVTTGHPEPKPDGRGAVGHPGSVVDADFSPTRIVHLTYRDQTPADHARSCYARRPKPKTT